MNDNTGTVEIRVNGEPRQVPAAQPLLELITDLGLSPAGILIERNGEALLRGEWEHTHIADGDRLEILRVVAGG